MPEITSTGQRGRESWGMNPSIPIENRARETRDSLRHRTGDPESSFTDGIGPRYDRTLMNWWIRFECARPAFRARQMHLFQVVFSPTGVPGGYEGVR